MNELKYIGSPLRGRVDATVRSFLQDLDTARSVVASSDGGPRPIVLDANRLRGELRTLARSDHDTALCGLARIGFLRLFAARHVLDEVDRYLDQWATETRTPVQSYRAAWESTLRPMINEVFFSADLLTPDERARIELLNLPAPYGDPDDVPTAIAAMVLAAPLLSADSKLLTAVYGLDFIAEEQDNYVESLFAAGRVLVLAQYGRATVMLVRVSAYLSFDGVRALTSRTRGLPLALLVTIAGAWLLSDRPRAEWRPAEWCTTNLSERVPAT